MVVFNVIAKILVRGRPKKSFRSVNECRLAVCAPSLIALETPGSTTPLLLLQEVVASAMVKKCLNVGYKEHFADRLSSQSFASN